MLLKKIIILTVVILITIPIMAKKRTDKTLKMSDFTQVNSPSYVPFPYPKSDAQVITDLKYAISTLYSESENSSERDNFLPNLLQANSKVQIKKILKVKNKIADLPDEYTFLIDLHDLKTKNNIRVAMQANGLFSSAIFATKKQIVKILKTKDQIVKEFSGKGHFKTDEVKSLEWVAYDFITDNLLYPLAEITLHDGSVYFLDHKDNMYRKHTEESISSEEINRNGTEPLNLSQDEKVIYDSIAEKRIYLVKL